MPYTASPLRYPGGKTQLAKFVDHTMQLNNIKAPIYCEPFAGGAGIAITLLLKNSVDTVILNDIDTAIYSVWYAILNDADRLCQRITDVKITMNTWRIQKHIYETLHNSSDYSFELAFATFFLNRTNRAGIIGGGPIGGYEQNSKYTIDCRFNKTDLIRKIRAISQHRDRIILYHLDAVELINTVLLQQQKKALFTYFDPPYYTQGKNLYMNSFDMEKHIELADAIKKLDGYHWIVTYDDAGEIEKLYSHRAIRKYSLRYSANKVRKETEIFFSSNITKTESFDKVIFI